VRTEQVAVPALPAVCGQVMRMMVPLRDAAAGIQSASTENLTLMDGAAGAMAAQDIAELNTLAQRQRDLENETLDEAIVLGGDLYRLDELVRACQQELP